MMEPGIADYVDEVVGGRSLCFYACFLMFGIGAQCFVLRCVHPCFQVRSASSNLRLFQSFLRANSLPTSWRFGERCEVPQRDPGWIPRGQPRGTPGRSSGCLCRRAVSVTFVYVETAKDTAVVDMECEQKTVPKLSNGSFNALERLPDTDVKVII